MVYRKTSLSFSYYLPAGVKTCHKYLRTLAQKVALDFYFVLILFPVLVTNPANTLLFPYNSAPSWHCVLYSRLSNNPHHNARLVVPILEW